MIPIKFVADPLPANFTGTLQDFQDRFLLNLRGLIDDTQVLIGQVGGSMPASNVGPWLNVDSWYTWNGSEYVPSPVKVGEAGYVVQLGSLTTVGAGESIIPDKFQSLQDKDGVIALTSDIYSGRPTVVLTGNTPDVDWNLSNNFSQVLAANATIGHINSQPGQKIRVLLSNPSTYTVTWRPPVFWQTGIPPVQTTSGVDLYEFENVGGSLLGRQLPDFS